MSERILNTSISQDNKRILQESHSTNLAFINELSDTVPEEEMDDVLDIRDFLTFSEVPGWQYSPKVIFDAPSAKMLKALYETANHDIDVMRRICEKGHELRHEFSEETPIDIVLFAMGDRYRQQGELFLED